MSGIGWPSHDEDEKSRIARCYTEADQPTGCPLCILRAENERLRAAATEALVVLTRLADAGLPVPLGAEIDAAKARLAGVLRG